MKCKCNSCNRVAKEGVYCLTHSPKRQRESRKKNPERFKHYTLKRDYGISLELYQKMLVDQRGLCAICEAPSGSERSNNNGYKTLSVDHNHASGAIRGLLCSRCNKALGDFMDRPDLLRKAAEYLEYYSKDYESAKMRVDKMLDDLMCNK